VSVEARESSAAISAAWSSSGPATPYVENATEPSTSRSPCRWPRNCDQLARSGFGRGRVAGCRAGSRDSPCAPPEPASTCGAHDGASNLYLENRNGKAIPTLGSLQRLATALEVNVCQLVRNSRSRRDDEVAAIPDRPVPGRGCRPLPHLDSLHRTLLYGAVRDAAMAAAGARKAGHASRPVWVGCSAISRLRAVPLPARTGDCGAWDACLRSMTQTLAPLRHSRPELRRRMNVYRRFRPFTRHSFLECRPGP